MGTITKVDLELQFKQSTGLRKEHNPRRYEEWVENYLLEELNKDAGTEFVQNDFFIDGGEK